MITVITTYEGAIAEERAFETARDAGRFISEEILRPETVECACPDLGLVIRGASKAE